MQQSDGEATGLVDIPSIGCQVCALAADDFVDEICGVLTVVIFFMAFFTGFAFLYPNHEALHLTVFADDVARLLPSGLAGAVGMVRK
jgi:TLC ATP/ADP transporter